MIGTEDGPFGRPAAAVDIGDRLVVLDTKPLAPDGHQLLVLDKQSGAVVASSAPRGQGPTDLEYANGLQRDPEHPRRFWIKDYLNARLLLYDVDDIGAGPLDLVRISGSPFQAYWVGGLLWTCGRYPTEIVRRYARDGDDTVIEREIGEPLYPQEPALRTAQWNRSTMAVHPEFLGVATAFMYESRIQIYTPGGELRRDIAGPIPVAHDFDARTWAYVHSGATAEFVLGLFANVPYEPGVSYATRDLHVFDWEGKLLARSRLEQDILLFMVATDGRSLWGIRYDPVPSLVQFDLAPLGELLSGAS